MKIFSVLGVSRLFHRHPYFYTSSIKVDSMEDLWPRVIDSLKERVGQQNFDIWIKPIHFISKEGETVELEVPNRFFKEWITEHYSLHIKDVVSLFTQMPCQLQFRIRNDKMNGKDLIAPPLPSYEQQVLHSFQPIFNPKYTFDHFVVGASNQFAHAACLAVADLPARITTPLYLWGGGIGKDSSPSRHRIPYFTASYPSRYEEDLLPLLGRVHQWVNQFAPIWEDGWVSK